VKPRAAQCTALIAPYPNFTNAGDQAVLDRIDVTVLDVAAEILIVADQVFPEPTLPDASFAVRNAHRTSPLGLGNGFGKVDFDQPPAQRKIGVAGRQRPNRVDMIGQHPPWRRS
jgi:hypothetical protein